jgi:hypothetical protein
MIYGEGFPSGSCTRGMLEDWRMSILLNVRLSGRFELFTVVMDRKMPQTMASKASIVGFGVIEH